VNTGGKYDPSTVEMSVRPVVGKFVPNTALMRKASREFS
jgi:hypothetical protein